MKRNALGRGLSALIPDNTAPDKPAGSAGTDYYACPIEEIRPNSGQPRREFDDQALEELAASLREHGVVQPLVVRPAEGEKGFVLIAGERRWRAAQRAGIHRVPVIIRDVDANEAYELALVENIQRADLNPIEEAEAYRRLIEDQGYQHEQLAKRVGKDRSTISNALRLLKLPPGVQDALAAGTISTGHARPLLALQSPGAMQRAFDEVVRRRLSVRQTETLVGRRRSEKVPRAVASDKDGASSNVRDLETRLAHALHTRVQLRQGRANSGRIEIHYGSLDELDRLLEVLLK